MAHALLSRSARQNKGTNWVPMQHRSASIGIDYWHMWIFLTATAAIMLATAPFTFLQRPSYTATALLKIVPPQAPATSNQTSTPRDSGIDLSKQTDRDMVKVRSLAGAVIDRLHLVRPAPFSALIDGPRNRFPPELSPDKIEVSPPQTRSRKEALDALIRGLTVNRGTPLSTLALSFSHTDPLLAARITNAFAQEYVKQAETAVHRASHPVPNSLLKQLGKARLNVETADAAMQRYTVPDRPARAENSATGDRQLSILRQDAIAAHKIYARLWARTETSMVRDVALQPDAQVVRFAPVPSQPSSPDIPANLVGGSLLAMAGGLGAAILFGQRERASKSFEGIAEKLHLPYLGGLPALASSMREYESGEPSAGPDQDRYRDYVKGLRTLAGSVMGSGAGHPRSVAITSALPNEGKTTIALGLARLFAMDGLKVVLVDTDMRQPRVAGLLGLQSSVGLQQVLNGDATADEALMWDEDSGMAILPMLKIRSALRSLSKHHGTLDGLLAQLTACFDVVILDTSPVLPIVEGRLIARKADVTVMLVHWHKTPDAAVEMASDLLRSQRVEITGMALTHVDHEVLLRARDACPMPFTATYADYHKG